MEKVFARDWFSSPLSVAVARTSQSPFPLAEIVTQDRKQNEIDFNYIDFVSFFNFRSVRP